MIYYNRQKHKLICNKEFLFWQGKGEKWVLFSLVSMIEDER